MSSKDNYSKQKFAAWGGTAAILAGQGALVRNMGPAPGFQTGFLGFMKSSARSAFMSAPWQVKAASAAVIGAGMLANSPVSPFPVIKEKVRKGFEEFNKK